MGKAGTLVTLGLTFAVVFAACGGKVVFVAQGSGGAGGASSSTATGPSVTTGVNGVGGDFNATTTGCGCQCDPGGCTDAETSVATSGVGGGNGCSMTCAQVLEGGSDLCPNAPASAQMAFDAIATCICSPAACAGPCSLTCAMMPETNAGCSSCETMAVGGPCSSAAADCSMN